MDKMMPVFIIAGIAAAIIPVCLVLCALHVPGFRPKSRRRFEEPAMPQAALRTPARIVRDAEEIQRTRTRAIPSRTVMRYSDITSADAN